ncbi:WD40-repeat-containing domain protein [Dunaliella salina]|uniref:WD40-repeat-containing domain protein n=1 Tax=Dunaliella salina TaxID=3046 RepID=A0ABQ7GQ32_DUNSA|nr:WD40-repeat-containing domain protein [Dunaliella salina]|eukprot:KAF5836714.1 WD40-repeat-containing domain protein [Dunaliella salina]
MAQNGAVGHFQLHSAAINAICTNHVKTPPALILANSSCLRWSNHRRTLLCVYQLHSGAINTIVMHSGFCVTASDDRQLRVWPTGFTDYLLEAEHESGVTSVGVSPDGLSVAVGTESGAIGTLDIPTHQYTPLLRSHVATVNAVAADPNRPQYCTASSDGTLRVWDVNTHQQLVEFDAPGEVVTAVAYHPFHHEVAAGFQNGRVRVFDVTTTTLVQEHLQHRAEVAQIAFSPDGTRMYTGGADGALCVYDVAQVYQPTKFLPSGARDMKVALAVSPDGLYLATVARDPYRRLTSLLLFHNSTLEPYMRIETDTPVFKSIAFSADSKELWAVAETNRLDRYELLEGQLLQQVSAAHRLEINAMAVDPGNRFVMTGGTDGLIKAWSVMPQQIPMQNTVPPHQAFTGHSSAVFGIAFQRDRLISVGDAENVYIWRIGNPQPPSSAEAAAAEASALPPLSPLPGSTNAGTGWGGGPVNGRSDAWALSAGGVGDVRGSVGRDGASVGAMGVGKVGSPVKQWVPAEAATLLQQNASAQHQQQQQQQLGNANLSTITPSPTFSSVLYPPPPTASFKGMPSNPLHHHHEQQHHHHQQQQQQQQQQHSMLHDPSSPLQSQIHTPLQHSGSPGGQYPPLQQQQELPQQPLQQHNHQQQTAALPGRKPLGPSPSSPSHQHPNPSNPSPPAPSPSRLSAAAPTNGNSAIDPAGEIGVNDHSHNPPPLTSPKSPKAFAPIQQQHRRQPHSTGKAQKDKVVGPALVRAAAPGSAPHSNPTDNTTAPAHAPMCVGVVGYTPCGVSQNVAWAAGAGLLAYAGVKGGVGCGYAVSFADKLCTGLKGAHRFPERIFG